MNEEKIIPLLEEIRDALKEQLKRQEIAHEMQKEQFSMAKKQFERAEKINDRAEAIQEKSASLVAGGRKMLKTIVPILLVLVGYVTWLLFR